MNNLKSTTTLSQSVTLNHLSTQLAQQNHKRKFSSMLSIPQIKELSTLMNILLDILGNMTFPFKIWLTLTAKWGSCLNTLLDVS